MTGLEERYGYASSTPREGAPPAARDGPTDATLDRRTEGHLLRARRRRPLANLVAARSLALALVDPLMPTAQRAETVGLIIGGHRAAAEQAVRLLQRGSFRGPSTVTEEAVETLRLALRCLPTRLEDPPGEGPSG